MKFKKGDRVKTWISDKIGKVVDYDKVSDKVYVKVKGTSGYDVLPASMCSKIS